MLLNSVGFDAKIMHGGKQPSFKDKSIILYKLSNKFYFKQS